jgi:type II secretion system protein G
MSIMARTKGFTIVELLIVIVVIGILAAITMVAYSSIQTRAKFSSAQSDLAATKKAVEAYRAEYGSFPDTGGSWRYSSNGVNTYIPGVVPNIVSSLPQLKNSGPVNSNNCYIYNSDGTQYSLARLGQPSIPADEWALVSADMKYQTFTDRWGYWQVR